MADTNSSFVPILIFAAVCYFVCRRVFSNTPITSDQPLDYSTEKKITGRYTLHIVGEQYENREHAIHKLSIDAPLILKREPNNQYDKNAVAILTELHEQIGYLSSKNAIWVARILDEGYKLKASVASLFNDNGFVNVQIHIDGVPSHDEDYR